MPQQANPLEMLVIDDDEGLRETIIEFLGLYGQELSIAVNIDSASNGRKGLDKFNERLQNKPYDAVLTDLNIPVMGGKQVAAEVKRLRPETLVYIISGWQPDAQYAEDSRVARGLADRFIQKPIKDHEFPTILQEVFARKYPPSLGAYQPRPQS